MRFVLVQNYQNILLIKGISQTHNQRGCDYVFYIHVI